MAFSLSSVPGSDDRPHRPAKKPGQTGKALKERLRNALITGTAGGYLGGMLIEGKARVKVPAFTRKLLRMKRKTIGIHGARTGALAGAAVGATNKGARSETADAIGTGGDWKFQAQPRCFSAYIEDMTFASLPKDVQADVTRFVDAAKGTPVVHYGMTVKELLDKADPVNLATARKNLGTLRASRAADEVLEKTKSGSKYVLLMNDRVVDGHHFLAKAERGNVTSSLNVLDLTPARIVTAKKLEFLQFEDRKPTRVQSGLIGAAVPVVAGAAVLGTRSGRNALRGLLSKVDRGDPRRIRRMKLVQKRKDASVARNTEKAVAAAREKFRAEALPKAPKDPTLGDAVKTVKKRVKQKVVKAVSNIGASPAETQMSARFAFEESFRRSKVRDLRDKIGLAKDVAGLGVTVGAGLGARKLYKAAKPEIKGFAKRLAVIGRTWHRAGVKTGKTLDTVKDAVAPAAATNRGLAKAGGVIVHGGKKVLRAVGLMGDARVPVFFAERSKLEKARDASLATAGAVGTGAVLYGAHQIKGAMKHAKKAAQEVKPAKIAENIRNTTAIGGDVGKAYRWLTDPVRNWKRTAAKTRGNFRRASKEAASNPAPKWAKRVVSVGKKLKVFSVPGSRLNQFGATGVLTGVVGGLVGSAVGNKFRYPAQNWLKKKLVPKIGRKWGRRIARAGAYVPETLGSAIGGGLGAAAGGGMRVRAQEMSAVEAWQWRFGGKEQLKDIDRGGFLDPLDVFVGRKKGYTSDQVKKYNRLKNYVEDVRTGRRKGSGATVASAEAEMKSIRGGASKANHGQVVRSLLRKGDDVRRVTERGGGLVKDAVAHLRGDPRERDASGRPKKREWEKGWFQRTKGQLIAGAALGGGYVALKSRPKLRAKIDRGARQLKRVANKVVPDFFPDVKPLRQKGQKTAAKVQAKQQQAAQAKTAKVTNIVRQAAKQTAQAAAAIPKKSPAPMKKAASKPAAPKAPVTTVSSSKSPSPPVSSSASNPWAKSKLASTPPAPTAAEKAVADAKAKKPKGKTTLARLWAQRLHAFDDPLDVGWDLRDARGRSARVFAPGSKARDRRPKQWHERIDNERKLWAGAALAGTAAGAAATGKLMGRVVKTQATKAAEKAAARAARWKAVAKNQRGRLQEQAGVRKKVVSFPGPEKLVA